MSASNPLSGTQIQSPRHHGLLLGVILATEVLILCLPGIWWGYAGLSLAAAVALFAIVLSLVRNRATGVILGWVLIFPLGYYFASFPRIQPLITLDRAFIGLLLVGACLAGGQAVTRIPGDLRKTAVYWTLFVFFAAITIPRVKTPLNSLRVVVESFVFPGILAWFVTRYFDVRKHLPALHVATAVMAIYVAIISTAEVILQQDLLALPDSAVILAGDLKDESAHFWTRPNGPFSSTNSLALIGLVSLLFLIFLRKALSEQMPWWQRIIHRLGVAAALLTSLLPLFRSVIVSLAAVLLIDAFYHRGVRRLARLGAIAIFVLVTLALQLALPEVLADRTDPDNVYGRIAEQRQVLTMFLDHPLNGVGLNNFYDAAQSGKYVTYYQGVQSVDYPHSNLGAVLSETGLSGFVPYVVSQMLLAAVFWRLRRKRTADSTLVWRFFFFLFLAYWFNGLSLTSGYYADLNLWYMLILAVLYKFAVTEPHPAHSLAASPHSGANV